MTRPATDDEARNLLPLLRRAQEESINAYFVECTFIRYCLGGIPKDPKTLEAFLRARMGQQIAQAAKLRGVELGAAQQEALIAPIVRQRQAQLAEAAGAPAADDAIAQAAEDAAKASWSGFYADDAGPYLGTYQVKAAFREAAVSIGLNTERRGLKQSLQVLVLPYACDAAGARVPGVKGDRLYFYRGGKRVAQPDGFLDRVLHVEVKGVKQSALQRSDCMESTDEAPVSIFFRLEVPARMSQSRPGGAVGDAQVVELLKHMGKQGLGACRTQGFGQFEVTRLERLTDNPAMAGKAEKAD